MTSAQLVQPPQPGPGHSLPGLGHAMQQSPPSSASRDREREAREREYRERELERDREIRERQRQDDFRERERAEREREQREREHIERQREQQQQQHPVQNHTGSIPLQQPVAVKAQNSFTGPNGILSNMGASVSQGPQQGALPPHNGMGGMFNNPIPNDGTPRPFGSHVGQGPPMGFGVQGQPQMGGGVAALAQGQQPILNVSIVSFLYLMPTSFLYPAPDLKPAWSPQAISKT
jgi:paired amphipathic helix protein Sin3a